MVGNDLMDSKVFISLISVGFGWILAQLTSLIKQQWMSHRLKTGLLDELVDVKEQTQRVILAYARKLQIYAVKGIEPTASVQLYNMFF